MLAVKEDMKLASVRVKDVDDRGKIEATDWLHSLLTGPGQWERYNLIPRGRCASAVYKLKPTQCHSAPC